MTDSPALHLFDACGIELEYMIVDRQSLDIRPISHHLLQSETGQPLSEVEHGDSAWSNELTQHVIEIKTAHPRSSLAGLADVFQHQVQQINRQLQQDDAQLLPTAMHPWMDPDTEMKLWPYDYSPVYQAFHRVFDCRGHGWANLQSMHINLPFCGDAEFGRLHAAIRIVLPLLPGLAASSPFVDGKFSGMCDKRLDVYANNARKIPAVTSRVIPEPVYSQHEYEAKILQPLYSEIAPHDPDGVLQDEFLNARGAIARFDRGAIEIRVIDVQECPLADLAIAGLTIAVVKQLVAETWSTISAQQQLSVEALRSVFDQAIRRGDQAVVEDTALLAALGLETSSASISEVWRELYSRCHEEIRQKSPELIPPLEVLMQQGCLARRMIHFAGTAPEKSQLHALFQQLAQCLADGRMFIPNP